MQIRLNTPRNHDTLAFFHETQDELTIDYRFRTIDYRFSMSLADHQMMLMSGIRQDRIVDILKYLRSGSKPDRYPTLSINNFTGIVSPPLAIPSRWCYGSGELVEEEYFWEWYPNEATKALILSSIRNHLNPILNPHPTFKALVPYKFDREIQIESIPIYQLAGMVHANASWLFSSEDKDEC